jgi:universal stress protein A
MYKRILHATDLLSNHECLTEKAIKIAKQFNATIYLLHVIELPTSYQVAQGLGFTELVNPAKDDAQTVLSLIGENLNIPLSHQFVEIGSVKENIFNKVEELDCQLIIIGSHSIHGFDSILGSTAHAITNRAPCDVVTLRAF